MLGRVKVDPLLTGQSRDGGHDPLGELAFLRLRSSGLAAGLGGCKGVPMRTPTRARCGMTLPMGCTGRV